MIIIFQYNNKYFKYNYNFTGALRTKVTTQHIFSNEICTLIDLEEVIYL